MKIKNKIGIGMFLLIWILLISFSSATYASSSGVQYIQPGAGFFSDGYWQPDSSMCEAGQDFVIQITPFGCTPAVVRSDLLEEQNVPVFCQLGATKINPLIDVEAIESMSFYGEYSEEISGVGFHPAQAALGVSGNLNSPVLNNIGSVVIVLKKQENESAMPDFVQGNLTAKLKYDIKNAFGIGKASFYLPEMSEEDWEEKHTQYNFWSGRFYLRAEAVDKEGAVISIYDDTRKLSKVNLEKGGTSKMIYLPGFDCLAGLELKLDGLENPGTRAKLNINGEIVEVAEDERFLENRCWVSKKPEKNGLDQTVTIRCNEDENSGFLWSSKPFELIIKPKMKLEFKGAKEEGYELGDYLYESNDNKFVYLGALGYADDKQKIEDLYVYLVSITEKRADNKLTKSELESIAGLVEKLELKDVSRVGIINVLGQIGNIYIAGGTQLYKWIVDEQGIRRLGYQESKSVFEGTVKLEGFIEAQDKSLGASEIKQEDYTVQWGSEVDTSQMGFMGFAKIVKTKGEDTNLYLVKKAIGVLSDWKIAEGCKKVSGATGGSSTPGESDASSNYGWGAGIVNPSGDVISGFAIESFYVGASDCEEYYGDFENPDSDWSYFNFNKDIKEIEQTDAYKTFFKNVQKIKLSEDKKTIILERRISKEDSTEINVLDSYQNAIKDYDTLIKSFSSEKYGDITFGEEALYKKIVLAIDAGQKKTLIELCQEFNEKYSKSKHIKELYNGGEGKCDNLAKLSSSESSSTDVLIDGEVRRITFEGIYEPSFDDYGIQIQVRGPNNKQETFELEHNEIIYLNDFRTKEDANEYMQLVDLSEDSATMSYYIKSESLVGGLVKSTFSTYEETLKENVPKSIGDYTFTLKKINLKKLAKVSVNPNIKDVGTEANFSFRIGIEKRAIQLSPEKTKEKIESLNETIKEWEERSEQLGKVVQGLKTACLLTGSWLTVKNFFANTGGKAIARQEVMRGDKGWYDKCADAVNGKGDLGDKGYDSIDQCLYKEGDNIENDVNTYYEALEKQNEEIKAMQENYETKKFLTETHIDTDEFAKDYVPIVQKELEETLDTTREIDVGGGKMVGVSTILGMVSANAISIEQAKEMQLKSRLGENIDSLLKDIYVTNQEEIDRSNFEKDSSSWVKDARADSYGLENSITGVYRGAVATVSNPFVDEGTPIQMITFNNKKYYLVLEEGKNNRFSILEVRDEQGNYLTDDKNSEDGIFIFYDENVEKITSRISSFEKHDTEAYTNEYKDPKLTYYETEPYKGLPSVVPFDLDEGWYAYVSQTLPIVGNIGSYEASGRVSSLYVCNVWKNNREENKKGDDKCTMINLGTGQPYNQIGGVKEAEALKLVGCAVEAVSQASKAHTSGVTKVQISTACYKTFSVKVGKPAVDIPDVQCQDFMSPKDCQLLFNVCDPVICPSSRCNFGGSYPVSDVIQSGIIGSIVLCLPNIQEGIYIPVCLSGIKAGIDGLISVFTAYRDCLQESLDTGKMVGVCDEIYSIYLCEFFWRQALPIANLVIPKIMEMAMGQNVHGGGEYLGVQSAWENAGKSMDYFVQYYAADAYTAFKAKVSEGISDAVCDVFISGSYPSGGNLIDSLTEPDSPPQWYGRFDVIPFTTATVPPISQYKVYYHIYAGEKSRAYYKVYLKGSSESSYYQDTDSDYFVDSGYIPAGSYVDKTPDFTAPSGYKELCIMVNGQEECGFEQVSTSFAVDYIEDQYIKEQALETDIKTETECVSGTVSAYSLLTPSVEGAAGEMINPAIYNKGIIRICATESPGKGTDALDGFNGSRWIDVGYCGDKNMRCWLDRNSVENAVEFASSADEVLEEQNEKIMEMLREEGGYYEKEKINEIEKLSSEEKIKAITEEFLGKFLMNNEKARLLLLRADAYADLIKGVLSPKVREEIEAQKSDLTESTKTEEANGGSETNGEEEDCKKVIGAKIIEIAQKKKTDDEKFSDDVIYGDTGANSFECLVLQIAMQESSLQHCKSEQEDGNCFYCDEGGLKLLRNKEGTDCYGVMQIDIGEKANLKMKDSVDNFTKNVEFGIDYLIRYYSESPKYYECGEAKYYYGWNKSLRYYNGWNTDCSKGEIYYVEEVTGKKDKSNGENTKKQVIELFPELCGVNNEKICEEYCKNKKDPDEEIFYFYSGLTETECENKKETQDPYAYSKDLLCCCYYEESLVAKSSGDINNQ